jgi:cob(I)alamin adenosyltransferase
MTDQPGLDERIKGRKGYGLVQLIYGNGKGKTTASLGQAIRCAGSGRRVLIVFFDKGGTTHYNERAIIDRIPEITYVATGRDRIDPVSGRFDFSIQEIDRSEAQRGLVFARDALRSKKYDLVILDEINSTVSLGMLSESDVLTAIHAKHPDVELILSGRNPPESFFAEAHLITEVKLEKHYFYSGVPAREGLDY